MAYGLQVSYAGQALIDGFNFMSIPDPNDGFVAYQNLPSALAYGYVSINPNTSSVKLSVDSTNAYDPDGSLGGRPSIRIESKQVVNAGSIVIGDFAHMPGSQCGTWPAFWMYGPDWPSGGEIDIIEGANQVYRNLISAHTGEACTLPQSGLYTGTQQFQNCTYDEDIGLVEGCNYIPPTTDSSTYGDNFNAVGGGVYATEWTTQSIKIWHWPRNKIPQDIVNKKPDPTTWGAPQALFGDSGDPDSCDIGISFYNMSIVLDIDFCGSYAAGKQWGSSSCYYYSSSCEIWVGNTPSAFTNSFWEVNYIDVYSQGLVLPSTTPGLPATSGSPGLPTSAVVPTTIATPPASSASSGSGPVDTVVPPPGSSGSGGGSEGGSAPTLVPTGPGGSVAPSGNTLPSNVPSGGPSGIPSGGPSGGVLPTTPVSSSPSPTNSLVPEGDPATIGSFALLGCFASTNRFSTFTLSGDDGSMTPEVCVALCPNRVYAGVHERTCYCADALDAGTSAVPDRSLCNIPCPGNPAEICGGNNPFAVGKRDAPNSFLLTVYVNLAGPPAVNPPPAPGLGGVPGLTQTITTTITYTAVCPTNPALLVTQEYCTTLKDCRRCAKPSVPMTTVTQTCKKCGKKGESSVTLTVPCGVASGWANGGDNGWQKPAGPKPGDVGPPKPGGFGPPTPGGGPGQPPVPKPPVPGGPPVGPVAPVAPVAPLASPVVPGAPKAPAAPGAPGGGQAPGPQPGAKAGNATVPAPTQGVVPTGPGGFKPVQAGAERSGRTSAGVLFGVVLIGLLF